MNTKEYIESGVLELYVYGLLTEEENIEVARLAKQDENIQNEIVAIEMAIVNLSTSFSPFLSADNFEKIKSKLDIKYSKVIDLKSNNNWLTYTGWAASALLFIGIGFQYTQLNHLQKNAVSLGLEKKKLQYSLLNLEKRNTQSSKALSVIRDSKNSVINLAGQTVSPNSFAKIYWNKASNIVYVDASGLPEPPKGMVYQIWSLKLEPQLTPTSIGLLTEFNANTEKIFVVGSTKDAQAFGITLEPAGGSKSPTLEQLYTLGKV